MTDASQEGRHVTVSLADAREAAGFSQADLAARSGVDVRTIRRIEGGRGGKPYRPSLEQVVRLADALEVPIDDLILKVPAGAPT